jgi:hypothetical protein
VDARRRKLGVAHGVSSNRKLNGVVLKGRRLQAECSEFAPGRAAGNFPRQCLLPYMGVVFSVRQQPDCYPVGKRCVRKIRVSNEDMTDLQKQFFSFKSVAYV